MKTLYVLRHGQAAPESEAWSDHERPLTARGRDEARVAAERLAGRSKPPSLILSSSAVRARETAELCLAALPQSRLTIVGELYLGEPPSYLAALAAGGDPHDAIVVVGHNPGLEAPIYGLTQQSEHLATASLVEIELPIAVWSEVSGRSARSGIGGGAVSGTKVDHFRSR